MLKRIVLLVIMGVAVAGCTASTDPSKQELRSPCVSSGEGANDPCIKRPVIGNLPYLV